MFNDFDSALSKLVVPETFSESLKYKSFRFATSKRHFEDHNRSVCRYEDAYNRFVEEINSLAAYQWWEGSVHSILSVLAYPFAWHWQQWRRRKKVQQLRDYVRSEYDHACLRSCRSRALYEGLKVCVGLISI